MTAERDRRRWFHSTEWLSISVAERRVRCSTPWCVLQRRYVSRSYSARGGVYVPRCRRRSVCLSPSVADITADDLAPKSNQDAAMSVCHVNYWYTSVRSVARALAPSCPFTSHLAARPPQWYPSIKLSRLLLVTMLLAVYSFAFRFRTLSSYIADHRCCFSCSIL